MNDRLGSRLNDAWKRMEGTFMDEPPRRNWPFKKGETSDGDLLNFLIEKEEQGIISEEVLDELFIAYSRTQGQAGIPEDDESIYDLGVPRHAASVVRDLVIAKCPQVKNEFDEVYKRYMDMTSPDRDR